MIHERSAREAHAEPEAGNAETIAVCQDVYNLGSEMVLFAASIGKLDKPEEVLDRLQQVAFKKCKVNVLGAMLLPARFGLERHRIGKDGFPP